MQQNETPSNDTVGAVWRDRWRIALFVLGGGILGVIYNFAIPPIYQATTVILLPPPTGATASSFLLTSGAPNPLDIMKGVAVSKASTDYVAAGSKMLASEIFENINTIVDPASNQLILQYQDGKKPRALMVAKLRLDALTKLQAEMTQSMAGLQAGELMKSVTQKENELKESEKALLDFQKTTKTAPDPNTPFTGSAYLKQLKDVEFQLGKINEQLVVARKTVQNRIDNPDMPQSGTPGASVTDKWRDRMVQLQNDLQIAETKFGPVSPEVLGLKKQIEVTRNTFKAELLKYMQSVESNVDANIAELQANRLILEWQKQYLTDMNKYAPDEAVQFQRLLREVGIRGESLKAVRSQYEQSKIEAQVERIRWSVLVPPFVEANPVNKRPLRYAAIAGILAAMLGSYLSARRYKKSLKTLDIAPPV